MTCSIGVHAHEHEHKQRVRLNLDLDVLEAIEPLEDDLRNVVCYDEIISAVRRIVDTGHVRLIETLAEHVAGLCLADPRIRLGQDKAVESNEGFRWGRLVLALLCAYPLWLALAWLYSAPPIRLKQNGWWGNAACAACYEGLPWITGAAVMTTIRLER